MITPIESFLFTDGSAHVLTSISLLPHHVIMQIAPWHHLDMTTTVIFEHATIASFWANPDAAADVVCLPWDIIGVECMHVASTQWRFVLNCRVVEIIFLAAWPTRVQTAPVAAVDMDLP